MRALRIFLTSPRLHQVLHRRLPRPHQAPVKGVTAVSPGHPRQWSVRIYFGCDGALHLCRFTTTTRSKLSHTPSTVARKSSSCRNYRRVPALPPPRVTYEIFAYRRFLILLVGSQLLWPTFNLRSTVEMPAMARESSARMLLPTL